MPISFGNYGSRLSATYRPPRNWKSWLWLTGAAIWVWAFLSGEPSNFWHPSGVSDLLTITWDVFILLVLGGGFAASFFGRTVLEFDDQNLYVRRYILWFDLSRQIRLDVLQEPMLIC